MRTVDKEPAICRYSKKQFRSGPVDLQMCQKTAYFDD